MNLDIGGDGASTHSTIPKDAYGYALHYYNGDYKPIGQTNATAFADARTAPGYQPLYNGNIAASSLNIAQLGKPLLYVYGYDQLNRLKRQNAFKGLDTVNNVWHPIGMQAYAEKISYDANGNILTYNRHGADTTGMPVAMDSLTYAYNRDANGNITNNRLRHVTDAVPDANSYTADLKTQPTDNYQYDAIGNLVKDSLAHISNIDWTVYGKIRSITKNDGSGTISYNYNPSGQRISKTFNGLTTWYVRDAHGNTLAVYDTANNAVNWREQHLYGSRRLGIWTPNVNLANNNALAVWNTAGLKFFELTNHLGNVIATITDRRLQVAKDTSIDHYIADVTTAQDYYPFGMLMPGRSYNSNISRYGFENQEKSFEINSEGNHYEFKYREYDPRIGKFWSIDPLTKNYPWNSSYAFAENRVIDGIDLEGKEWQASQGSDGKTNVSVNVNFSVDKETNLSQNLINAYKKAINAEMNKILRLSSNNTVNGNVTFDGGDQSKLNQVIPSLNIYGVKPEPGYLLIGGQTRQQYSSVNIYKKDGTIKSTDEIARTAIHELFHTIRLQHPFEVTQVSDTRLTNVAPNKYITPPGTNPNILYNIMNYSLINIDGKHLGDLWKNTTIRLVTPGQINFILKEIHLQMNGAGLPNDKKYDWINFPGYDVKPAYDFLHPFKN